MSGLCSAAEAALLVLGCLGCFGCSKENDIRSSGPYVQNVTPGSAVVAAQTVDLAELRVSYAVEGSGELSETVRDVAPTSSHSLALQGLQPATTYVYRLESLDGAPLGEGRFTTAPLSSSAPCTFLVLGDSGGTEESEGELIDAVREDVDEIRGVDEDENQQGKVVGAMLAHPADLVLHLGDVVYPSGAREDYHQGFFRPFAPLIANVPVYPTIGNHDVKSEGGRPFLDVFVTPTNGPDPEGRTYSFDWGCVHFVCLDVILNPIEPGSALLEWLKRDLAANRSIWRVVYFHVPPYSATRGESPSMVEHLVPILEAARVDLVLSGHDHNYCRFLPREYCTYVVSGGGGKSLYSVKSRNDLAYAESVFHFLEVQARPKSLVLRAIDARGYPFDQLELRKE